MKNKLSILLFGVLFFLASCATTGPEVLQGVNPEDSNYAIVGNNRFESEITLEVDFCDENSKVISNYVIGTITPNQTVIFYFDADYLSELCKNVKNPYVYYKAFKDGVPVQLDSRFSTPSIWLKDLKNNYTTCHFTSMQSYISHNIIENPEAQKSTSVVYDETNEYIEFKLYDDLSWLKGKWVMTEGYGNDTMIINAGSPFALIQNYDEGVEKESDLVIHWMSSNHFSDTFYVNEEKTKMKTVHPYVLDESILLVSIYERVED